MDAIEALKTRRSIRAYREQSVEKEVLETIVDCARLAATACNDQIWEFVVVTDPAIRARIADTTDYGKFIAQAPACIAVFCKNEKYFLEDGAAATQNILVAARALGLGSCWVAGDKKPYADSIREILGVPEGRRLISLVPLGYPDQSPDPKKRSLAEVLHWERF